MFSVIYSVKNAVCSLPVIVFIFVIGVYFTALSGFYPFKKLFFILKSSIAEFKKRDDGVSPLAAFSTALGGTVGVGSIFGMGYAIAVGGAGSIFWMWVCALFAMAIKYGETYLSVKYRQICGNECRGGAMYIMKNAVGGNAGKIGAAFFCVCCIAASFGSGNMAQTAALSAALYGIGFPKAASAVTVALLCSVVIFKGGERMEKVNAFLVPLASISYFIIIFCILISLREKIPAAFCRIFTEAFGLSPAVSGVTGFAVTAAFREGALRGTFSHEAGMGSSPLAHASSLSATPETQGALGVTELFIDTFVVGTMTAVCLVASGFDDVEALFKRVFGSIGGWYLVFAVAIFAFAALISWCFYGERCVDFLHGGGKMPRFLYKTAVVVCAFAGCLVTSDAAYGISDIFNYLMMIPNLYLLFRFRRQITYG